MTPTRADFLSYYVADKYFWLTENNYKTTLLSWAYILISLITTFANLNYLHTAYYVEAQFADIVLNLSWLGTTLIGTIIMLHFKFAVQTGNYVWYLMETQLFVDLQSDLQHMVNISNSVFKSGLKLGFLGFVSAFIAREQESCDENSRKNVCGLIYPSNLFIDLSQRPYREVYHIFVWITYWYLFAATITCCSFLHTLMLLTEVCVKKFKLILKESQDIQNKEMRLNKLIEAYKLQQNIKIGWDKVTDLFKWPLLLQYLTSGVTVALILTAEINHYNLPLVPVFLVHIIGTVTCGFFATEMEQYSEEFRHATFYAIPWDGDVESAKFLIFMNMNLHNVFTLPLVNFAVHSNEQVLLTFKMTYTIVMCLINLTQKEA
ncbi:uncharacterized protein [Atheta coriaria]|uniref:uncharacterized protein n=1 Tax=Dalotia coriaria TaxID=877792 RepID=UPI0031F3F61F